MPPKPKHQEQSESEASESETELPVESTNQVSYWRSLLPMWHAVHKRGSLRQLKFFETKDK